MESIWMKDYKNHNTKVLSENEKCDILIIGGGLTGILMAYNLMQNKLNFKLVEGDKLVCGVSSKTTAQLSVCHDAIYQEIKTKHGSKKVKEYYNAQKEGLEIIEQIIKSENIKCDYEKQNSILYTNDADKGLVTINKEIDVLKQINANVLISEKDSFMKYKKAIIYPDQAIFNPMKYMMGIIDILQKNNSDIYENSRVTNIIKIQDGYEVTINNQKTIKANKIIMTCHYPLTKPLNLYFSKMYQSMSYAIAFETKLTIKDNYISVDDPYFYLRKYDDKTLIIGGCDHFSGIKTDFNKCYERLINKIYGIDPEAKILHQWSTEDCMPIDSLPYVGQHSLFHKNIYIITGFQKWGFTNAHFATRNITNDLLGKKLKSIFTPQRLSLIRDLKSTMRMIAHSLNGLVFSKLAIKNSEINDIPIGSGKVLKYKGQNVLVYREAKNNYIFLKNKCTHMGCSLIWNEAEKKWQSKCHGSIFDKYGKVLEGPATKDLEKINF